MLGHSKRCPNLATYWNTKECVPCELNPGFEVSPNCGHDDDGGVHEVPLYRCKSNTYNDGTTPYCRSCSSCPLGTEVTPVQPSTTASEGLTAPQHVYSAVFAALSIAAFMILATFFIHKKWRRGQCMKKCLHRRSAAENRVLSPIRYSVSKNDPEDVLSDKIQSAPLQEVLDNLDVLEELIILLDPEIQGIKNTKHLASLCSFPFPWVTYIYSMKDSKSPLKAVLERLISSHPDWTVGYLARLLKEMERNDAIAVLTKLRPSPQAHGYF
ncbi:IGF-like family receptor 1 [Xenentodon cancila]